MRHFKSKTSAVINIVFALIVVLIIAAGTGIGIYSNFHTSTVSECVVNGKDRTMNQEGSSDMRVYTDNCGTFSVADSILDGAWSSADTFSKIEQKKTYTFETRGLRIPLFSMFPNITKVTEVVADSAK